MAGKRQRKESSRYGNVQENAPKKTRAKHAPTRARPPVVRALPAPPSKTQGSSLIVLDLGGGVSTAVEVFQDGSFNETKYPPDMAWKIKSALKNGGVTGWGRGIVQKNYRKKVEHQMGDLAPPITPWQGSGRVLNSSRPVLDKLNMAALRNARAHHFEKKKHKPIVSPYASAKAKYAKWLSRVKEIERSHPTFRISKNKIVRKTQKHPSFADHVSTYRGMYTDEERHAVLSKHVPKPSPAARKKSKPSKPSGVIGRFMSMFS